MSAPTDQQIITTMLRYGGGFAQALARALQHADDENFTRIVNAFPELWKRYSDMAEQDAARSKESTP